MKGITDYSDAGRCSGVVPSAETAGEDTGATAFAVTSIYNP